MTTIIRKKRVLKIKLNEIIIFFEKNEEDDDEEGFEDEVERVFEEFWDIIKSIDERKIIEEKKYLWKNFILFR